jgi:hypothetical protein
MFRPQQNAFDELVSKHTFVSNSYQATALTVLSFAQ